MCKKEEFSPLFGEKNKVPALLIALVFTGSVSAEIVFQDDFDDQPDWTSTMHTTKNQQTVAAGDILPRGWYGIYQGTVWAPETGYPENHASLEILAENGDKAFGGKGKSAVMWRESHSRGWNNWASDSQLIHVLSVGQDELYVTFDIKFSENWWQRHGKGPYTSKIFRVGSWNGEGAPFSGYEGTVGPLLLWDYKRDDYGIRNVVAFRGGPHGENYYFNDEYSRSVSLNYTDHLSKQEEGGKDPALVNQLDKSQYLVNFRGATTHEHVFGPPDKWTKMAFYVRMNSAPGIADGVFRQWLDGHRIVNREDIPWVQESADNKMVKWNYVGIGGNDFFQAYPNSERFEDWYAIDNLVVMSGMPNEPIGEVQRPNPPTSVKVE